jgi:hypothetical protein
MMIFRLARDPARSFREALDPLALQFVQSFALIANIQAMSPQRVLQWIDVGYMRGLQEAAGTMR